MKPRVLAKNHVIQAYYQKIDFIEKTCASYHFSQRDRVDGVSGPFSATTSCLLQAQAVANI